MRKPKTKEHQAKWLKARKLLEEAFAGVRAIGFEPRGEGLDLDVVEFFAPGDHSDEQSKQIAGSLVENYPEHGFAIDANEASKLGLNLMNTTEDIAHKLDEVARHLRSLAAVGQFVIK